ncbi:class I SAM-dependent methyltransferase [Saccharopolyspora erythraea]|uniref:N5-glutamine methyltransferase family protein n=1 Tax=Saccharopolyspora erythraea TaxID=1836 RepID=UPI001BA4719E|nr:class I SAM-dependent methyltransferase [Saccharopolyspora erythraea]QUH05614.1 class I SAM-dependent methyltransferase [Saccharopolyspora erythraea]
MSSHHRDVLRWSEDGEPRCARWVSESGAAAPRRVVVADDRMPASTAHRHARAGTAILWRGDYHNARNLMHALRRRADARRPEDFSFQEHRKRQAVRARLLGMLLVPVDAGHVVPLRRAPDVRAACLDVHGPAPEPYVMSLRELLGVIGAREWRRKGVEVPALGARIHPHYGVFAPVRGEYVDLVAAAALPTGDVAFDIGTGTGVLAAVLAHRGVARVVATDQDPRALACARENIARLGFADRVSVEAADLFPAGRAALVVCNPPWIPAEPTTPIENAVYDPGSRMLRGFLAGLAGHLEPGGEGWLVLSDLAEHLGLRSRARLSAWIRESGLEVAGRLEVPARHRRAGDSGDPLHAARSAEVTSLWRLRPA